jgi:hypothetical protein
MGSEKSTLPLAVPMSPGIGGVSAPFSVLPENLAMQTAALGEAMIQFIAFPAAERNEGAGAAAHGDIALSFERVCAEAMEIFVAALVNALSENTAQAIRFFQEFAYAKGPLGVLGLQLGYMSAQAQLFAEQAEARQKQFARFLGPRGMGPSQ